jgi:HEAT repeat protein
MKKKEEKNSLPVTSLDHDQTRQELVRMTERLKFQEMCDSILLQEGYEEVHPRGGNAEGTVRGVPDTWAYDPHGNLCACMYGTGRQWRRKLEKEDLPAVKKAITAEFQPSVFVFCTNRHIDRDVELQLQRAVKAQYGWELRLFGQNELALLLDNRYQDIRERYLGIRIERHNWRSLLAACNLQCDNTISSRYQREYEPELYVPRHAERMVDRWYREAITAINQKKTEESLARFLPIIGQAGTGKTNLVIHLATHYGQFCPVLLLPGSLTLRNDHALEEEIVKAVEHPIEGRPYSAELHHLCDLAQRQGRPLLVILDSIDKNRNPELLRANLVELLTGYRKHPLLVLVTCLDATWHLFRDPVLSHFASPIQSHVSQDIAFPLGLYDEDEYRQAREQYFAKWNVNADLSVEASHVLRLPLLLRIFAEVFQNGPFCFVPSVVDRDLWSIYWERKIEDVYERMGRGLRKSTLEAIVELIAMRMLESDSFQLAFKDLKGVSSYLNPDDMSAQSLLIQLQNAAMLQEEPLGAIRFVHTPFLEFILGRALVQVSTQPSEKEQYLDRLDILATRPHWYQVVLHIVSLCPQPDAVIEELLTRNRWLAANALLEANQRGSGTTRQRVIEELLSQLDSRFVLERHRASRLLGLLGASESKEALLQCWSRDRSYAALCALSYLGVEDVVEPFILYLGRFPEWYLPDDQEFVDTLPKEFRERLVERALSLLNDSEQGDAAAHTLGYLRNPSAVAPLRSFLEISGWCNGVAMVALLRIGTQEAFETLEYIMGEAGKQIEIFEQEAEKKRKSDVEQEMGNQSTSPSYYALMHLRMRGLQHCNMRVIGPFLTRLLEHSNFYVRSEAIQSLSVLRDPETALALVTSQSLPGENGDIQWQISLALQTLGSRIRIEPFVAMLRDDTTPERAMRSTIQALGASRDPRAIGPLEELIKKRRYLFDTIQALGELDHPDAVPVLVCLLEAKGAKFHDRIDGKAFTFGKDAVVTALGNLQQPGAFISLERYARAQWPHVWLSTIGALVATGREQAIPLLQELWEAASLRKREIVLRALLWIDTNAATTVALELVEPCDEENASLLTTALLHGRNLPLINVADPIGPVDDRIVAVVERHFDTLIPGDQQYALFALGNIATPLALQFLERVAHSLSDEDLQSPVRLANRRTAIAILRRLGSVSVLDDVLDELADSSTSTASFESSLAQMKPRSAVIEALQRRLAEASEVVLICILELLGMFGDQRVLVDLQTYTNDPRQKVANAAYEAQQRILGLVDLYW